MFGRNTAWLLSLLCLAAISRSDDAVIAPQIYQVGIAKQDITPDYPIRLSGFGGRRTESEGIGARIYARALAIGSDHDGPALLIVVDTTGISDAVVGEIARRLAPLGVKREKLVIAGTHTHTAPMLKGVLPTIFGQPIPPEHQAHINRYTAELTDRLEQVAKAALADRQPAQMFWGVGELKFSKNRRPQGGPVDHDLPVLAVKTPAGKLRAVLATYACHAVTLSHNLIGGDWPGFAVEAIERQQPGVTAMISIGCGADQNPLSGVTGDKVDIARGQGAELADEVARVLGGALRPINGTLNARQERIELPLDDLPPRTHWEELAKKTGAVAYHAQVQLATLDRGESLLTKLDYPVTEWNFGDSLAMVFLPGEVVVDYSVRLKREFDASRLWLTAYANDTPCYIPSERVLKEGGYEGATAMTYYNKPAKLAPGVEQRIVDAVHRLVPAGFEAKKQASVDSAGRRLSPQQSQRQMEFRPGWRAQLVAAEPLTTDPVAIDFGIDGCLWVCEMHDYPAGLHGNFEPGGRVRILRDDDGDGVYDRSTIFLDGLPFPTGVTVWRKGVLVCAAPDIIYAEDTDGDDRADVRKVLFSGFGTENYQARVNSLTYGLDGWVYGACGLFGGDIRSHITGQTTKLGNHDFRINPDRGLIEPVAGRTQQGRVRTDDGDWLGCNNSQPFLHYPLLSDRSRPGLTPPPLVVSLPPASGRVELFPRSSDYQRFQLSGPAGRVTAACGLGIYRDDWLADLAGNAIICEPVNLLLHRRVLQRKGLTFTVERAAGEEKSELLTSTDNWFRPVQVRTGPDGGLWVVDMSRAVIEHPRWIPEEVRKTLDVRAGEDQGRIYRLLPKDRGPRPVPKLSSLNTSELVEQLYSPNGIVRDLAQQMLLWRDDRSAAPALERLALSDASSPARSAALWILARWQRLSRDVLKAALTSSEPRIRRQAAAILKEHQGDFADAAALVQRLSEETDSLTLLELIEALGRIGAENQPNLLAQAYRDNLSNSYLRFAVLRAVPDKQWPAFVATVMASGPLPRGGLEPILSVSLAANDAAALRNLTEILPASADGKLPDWPLVEQIAVAWSRSPQSAEQWLPEDRRQQLLAAIEIARQLFADSQTPDNGRAAVAGLLGLNPGSRGPDIDLLASRLSPQSSPALQSRIIAALDRTRDSRVPGIFIERWASLGPAAKNDILDRLLSRPESAHALLSAIADGRFSAGWLDATRRQALLTHSNSEVRRLAASSLGGGAAASRISVIEKHRGVLQLTGDVARGREIYRKRCSVCHVMEGEGSAVGPDLAESRNKSWSALLTALLDPNQAVDQRYAAYTVLTTDGRTLQGLLAAENESSITLKSQEAKLTTLARSEIEQLASSGRSLMPEGLERDLSLQDFADLCAAVTQRTASGESPLPSLDDIARQLLDDSRPRPDREAIITQHADRPAELIAALTAGLGSDAKEEYRRIPWIWRVAVAAGKKNDAALIKPIFQIGLPQLGGPFADWQVVVIGGGIANGISLAGGWPHERIAEIIFNDGPLKARWRQAVEQAGEMAHRDSVPNGTRYDALRIIALEGWARRGEELDRYLTADANAELQMGAVSGLVDMPDPQATEALIAALPNLKPRNRELTLDGLLRSEARMLALLDALADGRISRDQLGAERTRRLVESQFPKVKERASTALGKHP
jgi:putative membrane-bound dehydrogenase-like protein